MDTNLLKNLGLDSSMNHNDLQLLEQILNSVNSEGSGSKPKISAKERNNLINKLSSNTTLNEEPKKELTDMNEQEKKIYREELRQKLKNKQNQKKMMRTSNLTKQSMVKNNSNYSDAIGKITEMMKNIDTNEQLNLEPTNKLIDLDNDIETNKNIINQNEINKFTNDEPDNLDDYLN